MVPEAEPRVWDLGGEREEREGREGELVVRRDRRHGKYQWE